MASGSINNEKQAKISVARRHRRRRSEISALKAKMASQ
jgi:hypothetical protein